MNERYIGWAILAEFSELFLNAFIFGNGFRKTQQSVGEYVSVKETHPEIAPSQKSSHINLIVVLGGSNQKHLPDQRRA